MLLGSAERSGARERTEKRRRFSTKLAASVPGRLKTVNEQKLLRTAQEYRKKARDLQVRLEIAQRNNCSLKRALKRRTQDLVEELAISPVTRRIVQGELKNFRKKPKGRRWTMDDKLWCLAFYKRSRQGYRFVSRYMVLPSESTLKDILKHIVLEPGVSQPMLEMLKSQVADTFTEADKHCVVLFDEIFLRGRLDFKQNWNRVDGFEDFGSRGRTNYIADHALVFMVQGLQSKWTQPIAFYFVNKCCPSSILKLLICDVVRALFSVGLYVHATVSDQGSNNRGAIGDLKEESGDSVMYFIDNHRLVHVWDIPHVFKNIRNNLITSDLDLGDGSVAKWAHLIELFTLDEGVAKLSKLTYKHLNPKGRDKMRVPLAVQTFSETTYTVLKTLHDVTNGQKLSGCMPTATLCRMLDKYFDLCNGSRRGEKAKPYRVNVSDNSVHHVEWRSMVNNVSRWSFRRKSDGARHVPPCVKGLMENVKSFHFVWNRVRSSMRSLNLRNVNQDAVENLFCVLRQCAGSSSDLTCQTFIGALKTTFLSRYTVRSKTKNCQDDGSFLLSDLRNLLQHQQDEAAAGPNTASLVRGDEPVRSATVSADEPSQRLGPGSLWASLVPTIRDNVQCSECLGLLTTPLRTLDVSLAECIYDVYPSQALISMFMEMMNCFDQQWKQYLHKDNITVACSHIFGDVSWGLVLCELHQSSAWQETLLQKAIHLLIKARVRSINRQLRDQVFRRSRQVLDPKSADGLRIGEEMSELPVLEEQRLDEPGFTGLHIVCVFSFHQRKGLVHPLSPLIVIGLSVSTTVT